MRVLNQISNHFAGVVRHMQTKQKAVQDGQLNLVKVRKYINSDDKLGKTIFWKTGRTECLSTHKHSKTAGLFNAIKDSRKDEKARFVNAMLKVAVANHNSKNADVKAAALYLLSDWQADDCQVTVGLQNSLEFLATAQEAGQLA